MQTSFLPILIDRAGAQGVVLHDAEARRLLDYVGLLEKWNQACNLTAIKDPQEMLTKHVLDSLSVAAHLHGVRIVDVGSGAGLPGLPLAIVFPEREFLLLDSNGKKTRFLMHATQTLGLANVTVHQARVEDYRPKQGFATVISRAFASLVDFVESAVHLCAKDGIMLAMKGTFPQTELEQLPSGIKVDQVLELVVAGLDAKRHAVVMHRREE